MKKIVTLLLIITSLSISAQEKEIIVKKQIVQASCGQCKFNMEGQGCDLAVRIEGKSYFVDGTTIDDHGDAHAEDGFCSAIRKAEIEGTIVDNKFKIKTFKLFPIKEEK
ncbi:DUF6370 family protein [Flavobacterium sp.]|jgi:hypothetical protein|uniref:DUF6370 family protein n=1 Tax=Flavobacterium sp. TaxID=239 RepID=UPI002A82F1A4|nr:DUF6370 family protein [Flavobacterium sp.]